MKKPHYIYRSAVTGKLVTKKYALRNPKITVRERVNGPLGRFKKEVPVHGKS